jgi:hypothetical protein
MASMMRRATFRITRLSSTTRQVPTFQPLLGYRGTFARVWLRRGIGTAFSLR